MHFLLPCYRTVISAGFLDDIETEDLCAVAIAEIAAQIKESGYQSVVKDVDSVKKIRSMLDFRYLIVSDVEILNREKSVLSWKDTP